MVLELLQNPSEMQIVGDLTVLTLLIGGIIMAGGVIIAKIAKLLFHKYYAKHRIINENMELRKARLVLVQAIKNVIKNGIKINILGKTSSFSWQLKKILKDTIKKTAKNKKLIVN